MNFYSLQFVFGFMSVWGLISCSGSEGDFSGGNFGEFVGGTNSEVQSQDGSRTIKSDSQEEQSPEEDKKKNGIAVPTWVNGSFLAGIGCTPSKMEANKKDVEVSCLIESNSDTDESIQWKVDIAGIEAVSGTTTIGARATGNATFVVSGDSFVDAYFAIEDLSDADAQEIYRNTLIGSLLPNSGVSNDLNQCLDDSSSDFTSCFFDPQSSSITHTSGIKRMFITEGRYQMAFAGLGEADSVCNTEASNAGLSGDFIALLASSAGVDSIANRFNYPAGTSVQTVDGAALWGGFSDVFVTSPASEITGPSGSAVSGGNIGAIGLATGPGLDNNCTDWTSTSGSSRAVNTSSIWVDSGSRILTGCSDERFFCVER